MVTGKSFVSSALSPWPYCGHNTTHNFFKVFISTIKQRNQRVEIMIYHMFLVLEELDAEDIGDDSVADSAKNLCFDTKT
jgi:hypothetical protein